LGSLIDRPSENGDTSLITRDSLCTNPTVSTLKSWLMNSLMTKNMQQLDERKPTANQRDDVSTLDLDLVA